MEKTHLLTVFISQFTSNRGKTSLPSLYANFFVKGINNLLAWWSLKNSNIYDIAGSWIDMELFYIILMASTQVSPFSKIESKKNP